jgi:hypothetical protein
VGHQARDGEPSCDTLDALFGARAPFGEHVIGTLLIVCRDRATSRSNSSASKCRKRSNASLSARAKDPMMATPLRGWINGDAAFLGFDMPVLRK